MPTAAQPWSLTSLREKLIKIGAKVVSHGRYVTIQMTEVAVPRRLFADILWHVAKLRAPRAPARMHQGSCGKREKRACERGQVPNNFTQAHRQTDRSAFNPLMRRDSSHLAPNLLRHAGRTARHLENLI